MRTLLTLHFVLIFIINVHYLPNNIKCTAMTSPYDKISVQTDISNEHSKPLNQCYAENETIKEINGLSGSAVNCERVLYGERRIKTYEI